MEISKSYLNDLVYQIIGSAIEVHKAIGPGLLESVYHKCMIEELNNRSIHFESERKVPVIYKGKKIDTEFDAICLLKTFWPLNSRLLKI
ncbi:GxxExxY protein [Marinilabilia salmonicolor]|jgi:GxxExxY protein|uniref:GxxExxY protein n=1 Tax=Marinilabilia salmonicolor TaxID=989 RepID=A0A368UNI3_9BACT|nr:GxxExxY protein [Marinilabilia salmonicolor]